LAVPIEKLVVSVIKRNAIKRGQTSSDAWNDSFEEVVNDFNRLTTQWNESLWPLLSNLPDGTNDLNAFSNGLDGRTLLVDSSATSTVTDTTFFNLSNDRPNNIKEQFSDIYTSITQLRDDLEGQISISGGALTDAEKERIGTNIFDDGDTSSSTSLDGKSENNRLNTIQIARDLYGAGFTLDNDGSANLSNSVMAMVDALLELHNGNWDNDISLSHSTLGDFFADGSVSMTGSLRLPNGSVTSPSLTFQSDQDSGLFRQGSDAMSVTLGTTETVRFDKVLGGIYVNKIRPLTTSTIDIDALQPGDGTLNITGSVVTTGNITTPGSINTAFIVSTDTNQNIDMDVSGAVVITGSPASDISVGGDIILNPSVGNQVHIQAGRTFTVDTIDTTTVTGDLDIEADRVIFSGDVVTQQSFIQNLTVITEGPYDITDTDHYVVVRQTVSSGILLNLPSTPDTGRIIEVKDGKGDAETFNVTVSGVGANIDGTTTFIMDGNYQQNRFVFDGTEWGIY